MAKYSLARFKARRVGLSPSTKARIAKLSAQSSALRTKLRGRAAGKGGDLKSAGITIAGGAVGGAASGAMPTVMGFDTRLVLGVVTTGIGVFGVKGKWGGMLALAGAGMLAAYADDKVSDQVAGMLENDDQPK